MKRIMVEAQSLGDWIAGLTTRTKADRVPPALHLLALSGVARRRWRTTTATARQHPGYESRELRKILASYKLICIAVNRPILDWEDPDNHYTGQPSEQCARCNAGELHSERMHYEALALAAIDATGAPDERELARVEPTHPFVLALIERWIDDALASNNQAGQTAGTLHQEQMLL